MIPWRIMQPSIVRAIGPAVQHTDIPPGASIPPTTNRQIYAYTPFCTCIAVFNCHRWQRRISRVSWKDMATNAEVRNRSKQKHRNNHSVNIVSNGWIRSWECRKTDQQRKLSAGTLKRSGDVDGHVHPGRKQSCTTFIIWTPNGKTCWTRPSIERNGGNGLPCMLRTRRVTNV